jgi:excisionase family DNA binding protein
MNKSFDRSTMPARGVPLLTPLEIEELAVRIAALVVAGMASRPIEDGFIDKHRAAELLGCSVPTLERRTADGSIPSHKIGRLRRYRASELLSNEKGGGAS